MEANYVGNWQSSPFNPDPEKPYKSQTTVDGIIDQALRYDDAYPGGVRWVTNSQEFIAAYEQRFEEAGVKKFSLFIFQQ